MWCWGPAPTCAASGKAESNVVRRSVLKRVRCYMRGFENASAYPKTRFFPAFVAVDLAAMRSSVS